MIFTAQVFSHNEQSMQIDTITIPLKEEYLAIKNLSSSDRNLIPALTHFRESLRLYKETTNLAEELTGAEDRLYLSLVKTIDDFISYIEQNLNTDSFTETSFLNYQKLISENLLALHDLSNQDLSLTNRKMTFLMQFGILFLVLSAIVIAILALSYKQSSHEKKLARQLNTFILQAQEDERKIISHELHDTIAQELKGIKFITSQLCSENSSDSETFDLSKKADDIASQAITNIRTICYNLTPPELEYNKLSEAVILLADSFSKQTGIECPAVIQCSDALDSISTDRQLNTFRIIQECLTNIRKHSEARESSIVIRKEENNIIIIISDDGIGFNADFKQAASSQQHVTSKHFGLLGIKDRVKNLNGKFFINSEPDIGTSIKISFPVISK